MSYSITTELHPYVDKNNQHQLRLLIICNRHLVRVPLPVKLSATQWNGKEVVQHDLKSKLNQLIKEKTNAVETKVIELLRNNSKPTLQQVKEAIHGNVQQKQISTLQDLLQVMQKENNNTLSSGRIRQYRQMSDLLTAFGGPWPLEQFNSKSIQQFHQYLAEQGYQPNTIWQKFNVLKTIRTQALKRSLIKTDPFLTYNAPAYKQSIPVYTTEQEMKQLEALLQVTKNEAYLQAGWYYLLSCYAGFRISDLKMFEYEQRVQNNRITLHTKKTGEIVSIPLHTRLKEVLNYCRQYPLTLSEQKCNQYIKELSKTAGINKRLKMHSGRHSFAMMLAENEVPQEDAMELMGITNPETISIYYRISNRRLDKLVLEKLG